ncbi:MAG: AMP-binding protein [Proteobacteria bacterium]|nr:AMP-binding protein [Pseudomonadota bacterium]
MADIDRSPGFFKKDLETMGMPEKEEYLNGKLREFVQHAYRNAPAFKEKLDSVNVKPDSIRTMKDLEKVPVTNKQQLMELQRKDPPFGGLAAVPVEKLRRIYASPGPIYEPGEREYEEIAWAQGLYAAGFRGGDIVVNTFSYHMVPFAMNMVDNTLNMLGCVTVPTGVGNTELQIGIMKDLRVTGYCGTPSFLHTVAEKAEEMGLDLKKDLTLRVGFVAAEMLPESLRDALEGRFNMVIRQSYGTADVGSLGYECIHKTGMHFPDDKIVEIVDPETKKQLPPGEIGEILATTFNTTYPLIRYATGDLSYVNGDTCPCGRTSARLGKIMGRVDQVTKVRGMFIHPSQVDQVVARHPEISKHQVLVTRREHQDEMTLRVDLGNSTIDQKAFTESVKQTIRDVMKLRGEVEIVSSGSIPDDAKKIDDQREWD